MRTAIAHELISRIDPEAPHPDDMTADEIEEWLDEVSGERLWDLVHERGEIYDGTLHLRPRDIEAAADALVCAGETVGVTRIWRRHDYPMAGAFQWEYVRDATTDTVEQWLAIFRGDEPGVTFVASPEKPRGKRGRKIMTGPGCTR